MRADGRALVVLLGLAGCRGWHERDGVPIEPADTATPGPWMVEPELDLIGRWWVAVLREAMAAWLVNDRRSQASILDVPVHESGAALRGWSRSDLLDEMLERMRSGSSIRWRCPRRSTWRGSCGPRTT